MSLVASGNLGEAIRKVNRHVLTFDLRSVFPALSNLAAFEGEEEEEEEEESTEEEEEESSDEGKPGDEAKNPRIKELSDEAARHRHRAKSAEKRAATAEARLKEIEDKEKDDVTRLQGNLDEAIKERDALREENQGLKVDNLFSLRHAAKFHDRELALLALRKDNKFEIDDDGEVEGLDEAVEALLKRKPHLAASGSSGSEGEGEEQDQPSGRATNGSKKRKSELDAEALQKKFPALRR